ncbi:MAG: DUF4159 domain-containing protein [Planctomycetota bacterium]|nr:DUF4159 domain-containing protein [Planctomycetota bacterium]
MCMRHLLRGCILAGVLLPAIVPADAQQAEEWDAQAVEKAIENAKAYLWSQWSDEHWPEEGKPGKRDGGAQERNYGGVTSLCAYALLAAGESPQDSRMKKTLNWLAEVEIIGTYARALRANVWGMLGRRSQYRKMLEKDVEWLVEAADSHGTYTYTYLRSDRSGKSARKWKRNRYDNSNSQFGVLGVWAGTQNGVEVPRKYWEYIENHWKDDQNADGGWAYYKGYSSGSYGSMSAAGLATMFICFDELYRREFIECRSNTDYQPIVRALDWMDKNFSATINPGRGGSWYYYYLYGVERVGLASGYKYFGKQDWYKLGTANLLQKQGRRGNWDGVIDTSFALLFLARGQHPVLFNKLKYPGSWNCRPRDLANFTRWTSRTFERPVNWQIIHLGVPVAEWHDAPILYISGATDPKFTDEDIESLRTFVNQGGVIFSEAACNRGEFNMAVQKCYAKMFPRYELARLDRNHPIYDIHFKIARRTLMGVSNGVRLLAIHSPTEVSLGWQMNAYATKKDIFELGANIYFYVTDKGSLRNRGVSPWPNVKAFTPEETLKVARVSYAGNYDPEPLAWKRFSILMGNRHGIEVKVSGPAAITDLDASKQPVAAMTGTTAFTLTDEENEALRKYIDGGGTLVVDAAGGSKAFAEAAEKAFARVLPEGRFGPIFSNHAVYTQSDSVIDKVSYRKAIRGSIANPHKPRLRGVMYKGRLAIILSREDLTAGLVGYPCWGLRGYQPESAFELMRNILMYANKGGVTDKTPH